MPYTGEKKNEYQREYLAARRRKARELFGNVCNKCGSSQDLEFDHIEPSLKSYHISSLWSRKLEIIWAELVKCQLLCNSCHKAKTKAQTEKPHGHVASYKRGCRCRPCTDANTEKFRAYRNSKRK